jgi:hypothetical protein
MRIIKRQTPLLAIALLLVFTIVCAASDTWRPYETTGIWAGGSDPTGWYKLDTSGNRIGGRNGIYLCDHNRTMAYNPADKTVWMITFWGDHAVKFDQGGNILRNVNTGRGVQVDIAVDPRDGSVWIVSGSQTGSPNPPSGFDGYLMKLDSEGNKLFERFLCAASQGDGAPAVGLFEDYVMVMTPCGSLRKYELDGDLVFDRYIGPAIRDMEVNEDGSVWCVTPLGALTKLDQQGDVILTAQFPLEEPGRAFSIAADPVTGQLWALASYTAQVVAVNAEGHNEFNQKYDGLFVPGKDRTLSHISVDPSDGGVIFTLGPSNKVVKIDSQGNVVFVDNASDVFSAGTAAVAVEYEYVPDTEGPTLEPVASSTLLWPPNHRMVDVFIEAHATDNTGEAVIIGVDGITSSEEVNDASDGNTAPDWSIIGVDQETGTIHVKLRAERSGLGSGRIYTVTITGTDPSGNVSSEEIQVMVPLNK